LAPLATAVCAARHGRSRRPPPRRRRSRPPAGRPVGRPGQASGPPPAGFPA